MIHNTCLREVLTEKNQDKDRQTKTAKLKIPHSLAGLAAEHQTHLHTMDAHTKKWTSGGKRISHFLLKTK